MNAAVREQLRVASDLYREAIATNDVSIMAESAVEYRAVLQLLGIDPEEST